MQDKEISSEEALKYILTSEADYRGSYSIAELKEVLMAEPFTVPNEKDAINLARYIIEDEQTERILFDDRLTNEVRVVYSIMKNLLGGYALLTPQQTVKIQKSLITVSFANLELAAKERQYHALLQDQPGS